MARTAEQSDVELMRELEKLFRENRLPTLAADSGAQPIVHRAFVFALRPFVFVRRPFVFVLRPFVFVLRPFVFGFRVLGSAARGAPLVLAILLFLFVTSEVWKFFGGLEHWRFGLVLGLFSSFGVGVVWLMLKADLNKAFEVTTRSSRKELKKLVRELPELREGRWPQESKDELERRLDQVCDSRSGDSRFQLSRRQLFDLGFPAFRLLAAVLIGIGVLSSIFFVLLGFVGVDRGLTNAWTGMSSNDYWSMSFGSFIFTEPLFRVSGLLGAVAGFTFATEVLREPDLKEKFIREECAKVRRLGAAWVAYRAGGR